MTEEIKNKSGMKVIISAVAVIAALALIFGVVWWFFRPQPNIGAKAIIVEVVDNKGAVTSYNSNTDTDYLREALDEIDGLTIEGSESSYGLYINAVNGLTADYNTDGAYWSIYVNDEYGQYSIDQQIVTDGDKYTLKYETYVEE